MTNYYYFFFFNYPFQHDRIYSHLQFLNPRRKIMALESNMLYLAAAVILCSIFILSPKESDAIHVVQTLSNLVRIKENNIRILADLLFNIAVQQERTNP